MRFLTALLAAHFASSPPAHAAGFSTGFETGYDYGVEVAGQQGWVIDDPTPNLSFFADVNRSMAAGLGGWYDAPSGLVVKLSHPVDIPLAGARFSVDIAVIPSIKEKYPGRDGMAWCLVNPAGEKLLTLSLNPSLVNPDLLNITWSTGDDIPLPTGRAIYYNAPYKIDLTFPAGGAAPLPFEATITGSDSFLISGLLPGLESETLAAIEAHFIVKGLASGDNFMVFDNLSVVPPPEVDVDGDGYSAETEAWFGTSDDSGASTPAPVMSQSTGFTTLTFPSVPGRAYLVDASMDLQTWSTVTVTATAASTTWQDSAGTAPTRRFFRVRKP